MCSVVRDALSDVLHVCIDVFEIIDEIIVKDLDEAPSKVLVLLIEHQFTRIG
jgi:hypothetical protein